MKIAIVKYNAGNIQSVSYALNRLNIEPIITNDADTLYAADKIIFPGVGEASSAMAYLKKYDLHEVLQTIQKPVLGICLGMQLMCSHSEEGNVECLDIFDTQVKRFPAQDKIPHMGWNTLETTQGTLLKNINPGDYMYFVHSFYAEINKNTSCECNYILPFSAGIEKDNYFAFQFHPEKSGTVGAQILQNFITL